MMKSLSRSSVLDWYRRFKGGREDLQDGPSSGHPSAAIVRGMGHEMVDGRSEW
jgi:transposase